MKIRIDLDRAQEIVRRHGLDEHGRVQRLLTSEVARHSDAYVPMQDGVLKNSAAAGDAEITYTTPYARYQYYGELMLAPNGSAWAKTGERKHRAGRSLSYHGGPRRGKLWERRMWRDKRRTILNTVARAAGGKAEL